MADHDFSSVSDSTDWIPTRLEGLASVEAALRCQVCKDFYKTPMITTCAHTFCSLCIRRALAGDGKCPLCRASDQEVKLRSNIALEEAVDAFVRSRAAVLEVARDSARDTVRSPKRKYDPTLFEDSPNSPDRKRLRSSARLSRTRGERARVEHIEEEAEWVEAEASEDAEYEDEPDDGLAPCPICSRRMKEWQVFSHLDKCTGQPSRNKALVERPSAATSLQPSARSQSNSLERLPAINYSMLRDQALRKKMSELGISTFGSRPLLEKRHREWITIWNANCDAAKPKRRYELLQDLDLWERTQGARAPTMARSAQNSAIIRDKDFDGEAWAAKHDSSFKDLIANARKSREEAMQKKSEEPKGEEAKVSSDKREGSSRSNPAELSSEIVVINLLNDDSSTSHRNEKSLGASNTEQPTGAMAMAADDLRLALEPMPVSMDDAS